MPNATPPPVRQILFATDFSPSAAVAARVACDYARHFGARLYLLHVVWAGADPTVPPALRREAEELGRIVPVVPAVAAGSPAAEIVRYAEEQGVDLIILGSHGRTGVTRALLGSVAERVVRTAPCPVLTVTHVREGASPAARGESPPPALRRCLVCAAPSDDLICEQCRARIRGEALEHKFREERAGRA